MNNCINAQKHINYHLILKCTILTESEAKHFKNDKSSVTHSVRVLHDIISC